MAMSVFHMLTPEKAVDIQSITRLPEIKSVPLLAIFTHTQFEDCISFREQVSFVFAASEDYGPLLVTYHEFALIF
jgi:hypothetical protein